MYFCRFCNCFHFLFCNKTFSKKLIFKFWVCRPPNNMSKNFHKVFIAWEKMTAIAKSAKIHPAAKKCCSWEEPAICSKNPFHIIFLVFLKFRIFKCIKYHVSLIVSQRRDTLYIFVLTKYHTDVIVSRLCDSITQTWFGPSWYIYQTQL